MRQDTLGIPEMSTWAGGVNKATDTVFLPPNTSPRGLNSALALHRTGVPYVQKRKGITCLTPTPITGSGAILGQHDYEEVSTGIRRHVVTTATQIAVKDSAGAYSLLSGTLTSSALPSFATANNLAFIFNGTDAVKLRGTTVENVGIERPTVGTLSGAAGAAGLHNGTYELRVAYKNDNTGHISSASDSAAATVVVTNEAIDWANIPVSADPQVTHVLLLVRNVATQRQFYVADTVTNGTTTATTSILDENLVVVAPTTTNRNPPVSGIKYCVVYRGRLVVATSEFIYWSKIDQPEAFDPFFVDGIDSSGDPITGLAVNQDTLLVLKDDRTFSIIGDLGGSYKVTPVDSNIGCVAHKTIVNAGKDTYWWSRQGIVKYSDGNIVRVGMSTYGDPEELVNANQIAVACAVNHDERDTIYFALPSVGQDRNTFILPLNYTLDVLESEAWDPMDIASLGLADDGTGVLRPMLGNQAGQIFQLWLGNSDGVAAGKSTGGTFVASAPNMSFIPFTDPNGLEITDADSIERKVTIIDSDGHIVTPDLRPRIIAGGITNVLNITPPVTLTVGATYRVIIGGPNWQFDTSWRVNGSPWLKKRYEFLYLLLKGGQFGTSVRGTISFDYDELNLNAKDRTFVSASSGAAFDSAIFDLDVWDAVNTLKRRYRVARTGRAWRVRLMNYEANDPCALLMVGMQPIAQTEKD